MVDIGRYHRVSPVRDPVGPVPDSIMGRLFLLMVCEEVNRLGGIMTNDTVHDYGQYLYAILGVFLRHGKTENDFDQVDEDLFEDAFARGLSPSEAFEEVV